MGWGPGLKRERESKLVISTHSTLPADSDCGCSVATMPSLPPCHAELNPSSFLLLSVGYLITTRRKLVVYHPFYGLQLFLHNSRREESRKKLNGLCSSFLSVTTTKHSNQEQLRRGRGFIHLTSDSPSSQGSRKRNLSKTMKQKPKGTLLAGLCAGPHSASFSIQPGPPD